MDRRILCILLVAAIPVLGCTADDVSDAEAEANGGVEATAEGARAFQADIRTALAETRVELDTLGVRIQESTGEGREELSARFDELSREYEALEERIQSESSEMSAEARQALREDLAALRADLRDLEERLGSG